MIWLLYGTGILAEDEDMAGLREEHSGRKDYLQKTMIC